MYIRCIRTYVVVHTVAIITVHNLRSAYISASTHTLSWVFGVWLVHDVLTVLYDISYHAGIGRVKGGISGGLPASFP